MFVSHPVSVEIGSGFYHGLQRKRDVDNGWGGGGGVQCRSTPSWRVPDVWGKVKRSCPEGGGGLQLFGRKNSSSQLVVNGLACAPCMWSDRCDGLLPLSSQVKESWKLNAGSVTTSAGIRTRRSSDGLFLLSHPCCASEDRWKKKKMLKSGCCERNVKHNEIYNTLKTVAQMFWSAVSNLWGDFYRCLPALHHLIWVAVTKSRRLNGVIFFVTDENFRVSCDVRGEFFRRQAHIWKDNLDWTSVSSTFSSPEGGQVRLHLGPRLEVGVLLIVCVCVCVYFSNSRPEFDRPHCLE